MNPPHPGFAEALRLWLRIGCLGFGGPSGQIALLHREVVEQRGWVAEEEFARALKFCMLLPGPEAQQLATWIGWRLHGIRGGVAAGTLFVLPAAILLWVLGFLYVTGRGIPAVHGFLDGIKPVVVALVITALWKIGRRMLVLRWLLLVCLAASALFLAGVSYPWVVLGFGIAGAFLAGKEAATDSPPPPSGGDAGLALWVIPVIWALPMFATTLWLGRDAIPVRVGLLYAKAAVMSFGGAYAALSYVALHASGDWGWLTSGQMLDGIGLAETTPGPLLIALQFVAFVAAWQHPGSLTPPLAATLASLTALWSLFLPSFLWIFWLAPRMEILASHHRISGALSAIGAVVTAVIGCLAFWFAEHLFLQQGTLRPVPLVLALMAWMILRSGRLGMVPIILLGGGTGALLQMLGWTA